MIVATVSRLVAVFCASLLLTGPLPGQEKPPKARLTAKTDVIGLLGKRVTIAKFEGRFGEAIEYLRDVHGLPVVIDSSLKTEDDSPVENLAVRWPAQENVRLESLLRLIGDQVKGMPMVRPDGVAFVDMVSGLYESGVLKQPDAADPASVEDAPLLSVKEMQRSRPLTQRALVNASFKDQPLAEIIEAISSATGANVVLAPQAAEAAKQSLSVRFANTPVEAAIRTLCEMTELGVIEDANVLIVTTRERAEARAKEAEQKRKARLAEQNAALGGGFGGVGGIAAPADLSAEIAQLKEQNAQLKKQLDEIKHLLKK
jgi:hypothetical protein